MNDIYAKSKGIYDDSSAQLTRVSQVASEVSQLAENEEMLQKLLALLENKLSPVLSNIAIVDTQGLEKAPTLVPMAQSLNDHNAKLRSIGRYIESITQRIEI